MPESTTPSQPTAKSLNDLLRIRADNLDRIHHRFGAIGTAVGFKLDKISTNPPPNKQYPAILIFVPKKLDENELNLDQRTGKNFLLFDNSGKLSCRTDVIPAELEDGLPAIPVLTAENVAKVRRLNSGQIGLVGGVAIENLSLPNYSTRQLTASGALVRTREGNRRELGVLTNAHAALQPNTEMGLVSNPGSSPRIGVLESAPSERNDFAARVKAHLDVQGRVETHLDAAFLKVDAAWISRVFPGVDGLPPLGTPYELNLDTMGPIGMEVVSIGQQSGHQTGRIFAYGFSWRDSSHQLHWTDYLIYSKTERFSLPGDSGKLIVTADAANRPVALHWGGSFSQLRPGGQREWWGYATDIGRVLRSLNAEFYRGGPLPTGPTEVGKEPAEPDDKSNDKSGGKPVPPGR